MADQPVPGLHERLITAEVERWIEDLTAQDRAPGLTRQQRDWVDDALAQHVADQVRRALARLPGSADGLERRAALVGRILEAMSPEPLTAEEVAAARPRPRREALTWVPPVAVGLAAPVAPPRPEHGLVHPSLLFNGRQDVSLVHELRREVASADRIDAVVAFLKLSGLRLLEEALRTFRSRGGRLRLITSTYVGATDARAVEALVGLGARVRVAYEEGGTRLHAKAWHFHRSSGLSTAYIGSSNLSRSALTDGAEWNVRVTEARTPALLERFGQGFEQLWAALGPEDHEPAAHRPRLTRSLSRARGDGGDREAPFVAVEVRPKPHQEEALQALAAERAHGHRRNLVVAATGTGKTWISAFDHRRLHEAGEVRSLLFVAHRREILEQSRQVFRLVHGDPGLGELLVGGETPQRGRVVFASIQSLSRGWVEALDPEAFDMVIVDEFHHAAASTYRALLDRLSPRVLLGLTATPERHDGRSITHRFDHRVAYELRLWDALDAGLLAPFHYFGVHDPTDVESAWQRGRLHRGRLDGLYTGDDLRARRVLGAVERYVAEPTRMRALGFCAGVGHAERMAAVFTEAGLPAEAVTGATPQDQRRAAVRRLRSGALRAVFAVDVFNEGVDVPEVDTVLFLRPTESATVFLQQLGRGLRRHRHKGHLTVLDLVGHVHRDYRYEARYRALLGGTRRQVMEAVQRDFPRLPPGCAIQLEPQARDEVLGSIRRQVGRSAWSGWVEDLRRVAADHERPVALGTFLDASGAELEDLYLPAHATGRSWSRLRRDAGLEDRPEIDDAHRVRKRLGRLLHVDDDLRLDTWRAWLAEDHPPDPTALSGVQRALARMLWAGVAGATRPLDVLPDDLAAFWAAPVLKAELRELLDVLADRVRHRPEPLGGRHGPLCSHGTYTRAEVMAAYGSVRKGRLRTSREGPVWMRDAQTDVFFVTLDKSDDAFTPSIRYADYPVGPTRFHWESQNHTHDRTKVGRRYVAHEARGSHVVLMVRERPRDSRGQAMPFTCLGTATYRSHEGGRPMRILWDLHRAMPPGLLQRGRAFAA